MMLRPSTIELNPQLAQAWQIVLSQGFVEINGIPSTQQDIFIAQLVMSALSNGEKCLVLTEYSNQADLLKTTLEQGYLSDFCAIIQDKTLNDDLIYKLIEQKLQAEKRIKIASPTRFEHHLDKLERLQLRLNKGYRAVRNPVFGNLNWPELVGVFWQNQTQAEKRLLGITLRQEDYSFTFDEFILLFKVVQDAYPLYCAVERFDHPLKQLHPQVFLKKEEQAALRFTQDKLRAYHLRVETLIQKYNQRIETYGRLLRQHYEQHTQDFLSQTDQLLDQIKDKASLYGPRFLDAKLGKLNWYGPLSTQGKSAISAYKQLLKDYEVLKGEFERQAWFSFAWPNLKKIKSIAPIKTALESFENTLKNGHTELGKFIQEEQLRLNAKSVPPELVSSIQIIALEEEMEDLLAELNATELLSLKLDNKMLTLNKRKLYLTQIQQQLAHLQHNMPDFLSFYAWQKKWLSLPEPQQNLLKNLAENRDKEWTLTFQNWYLYQVLLRLKNIDAPLSDVPLAEYHDLWTQYQMDLPAQITYVWQQRKLALQQNFKKIKKRADTTETATLTKTGWMAYTELYPVIALDRLTALGIMEPPVVGEDLFDWVVILNRNGQIKEALVPFHQWGKRVVVMGPLETTDESFSAENTAENVVPTATAATKAFWTNFMYSIRPYFGAESVKLSERVENLTIPLSLHVQHADETNVAFLGDGFLSQIDATDFAWEYQQQQLLKQANWEIVPVWSAACWQNLSEECRKIAAQIITLEKQKSKKN